ncbi:MAG: hypothetical protein P1U36_00295 [Legionellaceae bacterium]|nr:hypothetical protein [Legionellaceae bacterium]
MKLGMTRLVFITLIVFNQLSHANTGALFNVASAGTPANINITLCLNGNAPLSCQDYQVNALYLDILTTAPNHSYPAAGIRINTPGYHLSHNCSINSQGYCLFSVSDTSASTMRITAPVTYSIGGTLSHLTQDGLVLLNYGVDNLSVAKNSTTFTFSTEIPAGSTYNITVGTQPTGQTCTVTHGTGTANADVTNISVDCLTLYGTSDRTGAGSNTLYTIEPTTGVTNAVMSLLDPGIGGQIIGSDGADLYAFASPSSTVGFLLIDLVNETTSSIGLTALYEIPRGVVFHDSKFNLSDDIGDYYSILLDGTVTQINSGIGERRGFACVGGNFYAVSSDNRLYQLDPADGSTIGTGTPIIINTGETVNAGLALTANPNTGVMYAMLDTSGGIKFVSINAAANATFISNLTSPATMISMAFHPADPTC